MNRKNFITTIGVVAGGALTGFSKTAAGETINHSFSLFGNEDDIWKVVKEEFSFPEGYVYLNTGGIGSVPRHVRSLVSDAWFQLETNPTPGHDLTKWNALKNVHLKLVRGLSFEEILKAEFITIKDHPRKNKQRIICFNYKGYIWAVPCILEEEYIFLKTLYPSRKYTKLYRKGKLV